MKSALRINITMYTLAGYYLIKKKIFNLFGKGKTGDITAQYRKKRYHYFLKGLYAYYCNKYKTNDKLVVFADDRMPTIPDNMIGLFDRFQQAGYECVAVLPQKKKSKYAIIRQFQTLSYCNQFTKMYAKARVVFLVEFFLPVYPNEPRPGCQVVQLWHACGAFKRFGYSTALLPWGPDAAELECCPAHTHYSLVPVSSPECVSKYAEAFHCSKEIVLPMGVPRTDIFFQQGFQEKAKAEVHTLFPEIGTRKIIVYAPTFRGDTIDQGNFNCKMDYQMLKNQLSEEYVIINKFHPLTRNVENLPGSTGKDKFVFDGTAQLPIEKALAIADIIISDYSSIIFEYSLYNRPMIFFAYDLDEYFNQRNFYYDYETFVPGPIAKCTDDIINSIRKIDKDFDPQVVQEFRNKFMSGCDGNVVERIFEHVEVRMGQ